MNNGNASNGFQGGGIVENMKKGWVPPHDYSASFRDFVALCLNKDPANRPTCEQLLSTKFIKESRVGAPQLALMIRKKEYFKKEYLRKKEVKRQERARLYKEKEQIQMQQQMKEMEEQQQQQQQKELENNWLKRNWQN